MLTNEELNDISAGSIKWTVGITVGAILSFIAGVIDGFMRPLGCHGK